MGGGKGSSTSTVQMTPEQQEMLKLQTGALRDTFLPAYQSTVTGAKDIMSKTMEGSTSAASKASDVASQTGALQQAIGSGALLTGTSGLANLFGKDYEQNQVNAALQAGRESARESQMGQNAMYGAAGGLGSARMALADKNLSSLNAQRQATAAAGAQALVQQNRSDAAKALMTAGQAGLTGANQAAASQINYAGVPQDVYSKYAQVVYGTPQASTTANFAGTQGQKTSSKGFGF